MSPVLKQVHVNVPFCMLNETYLGFVLEQGINPEIGLDAEALDDTRDTVFRRCADALHEKGLAVTFHGPFVDLSPGSIDPRIRAVSRQRFEQVLRLVPLFRPKTVVCHTGYEEFRHGYMRERWVENSLVLWQWFAKRLADEGGRLMLENVFEAGPEEFLPLLETLHPLDAGFCLDVGHQRAFSRSSLDQWLRGMGPFLGQLHLHDNHGERDAHLAVGQGGVDFGLLFDYLRHQEKERPLITLEPHVDQDLWPSLTYLEKNWPWK